MPDSSVFLRWVRLKQASKSPGVEIAPADGEQAAEPATGDGEAARPFDLASLPSIETIAAHTDIAAFLNAGVPVELTRAALRRAWATDPAIRDFIGIAENQWDFNDPTAMPGFGPLDPTDNVADFIAQMSQGLERGLEKGRDVIADVASSPADPVRQGHVNSEPPAPEPVAPAVQSLPDDAAAPTTGDRQAGEQPDGVAATDPPAQRPRRHGSALPR